MNSQKKSQGLPMNFIVLAVMAILILVVVVLFVTRGWQTGAANVQTAVNNCNSKCIIEFNRARTFSGTYTNTDSEYCKLTQSVEGMGDSVKCVDIAQCQLTRGDGVTCTISCAGNTATC